MVALNDISWTLESIYYGKLGDQPLRGVSEYTLNGEYC